MHNHVCQMTIQGTFMQADQLLRLRIPLSQLFNFALKLFHIIKYAVRITPRFRQSCAQAQLLLGFLIWRVQGILVSSFLFDGRIFTPQRALAGYACSPVVFEARPAILHTCAAAF
jgi:hypothetical protein